MTMLVKVEFLVFVVWKINLKRWSMFNTDCCVYFWFGKQDKLKSYRTLSVLAFKFI